MIKIKLLLLFLIANCQLSIVNCQLPVVEYLRIADNQSVLYYGKEQDGYPRILNHPYFKDDRPAKARLSYCGVVYPQAMLRLDLHRDELVALSPDNRSIVLFPENVDYAELHGQKIIYFRSDSLRGCPDSGYYILLYSGKCNVLKKQTADIMVNTSNITRLEHYFNFSTKYYLYKDGVYYTIRNKMGLLRVLRPYKHELKRFIASNKLHFRQNAEEFIFRTVSEYEKIADYDF